MRKANSLADVQIIFNDLLNERDRLDNSNWDRSGYQIKNTGAATDLTDVVILRQLNDAIDNIPKTRVIQAAPTPTPPDDTISLDNITIVY